MGWKPGQSGNPGGRRKKTAEERECERILSTRLCKRALVRLEELMECPVPQVALRATLGVLERTQVNASEDPLPDNHDEWTLAQWKRVHEKSAEMVAQLEHVH